MIIIYIHELTTSDIGRLLRCYVIGEGTHPEENLGTHEYWMRGFLFSVAESVGAGPVWIWWMRKYLW